MTEIHNTYSAITRRFAKKPRCAWKMAGLIQNCTRAIR